MSDIKPASQNSLIKQLEEWVELVNQIKSQTAIGKSENNIFKCVIRADRDIFKNELIVEIVYSINGTERKLQQTSSLFETTSTLKEEFLDKLANLISADIAKNFVLPAVFQIATTERISDLLP